MADIQLIVDNIRSFLAGVDHEHTSELDDLANSYAEQCKHLNDRLRRCTDFLHKGLRSEAIHLAEAAPNLIDAISVLDFPELAEWENICVTYGLTRPPKLRLEAAAELNEAYASEEPVQALLARHRVLALARAPISHRLEALRLLADYDEGNAVWQEDVQTMEAARVRELSAQAMTALQEKNQKTLTDVLSEIDAKNWRSPVPDDFRRNVRGAIKQVKQSHAVSELHVLLPKLEEAYAAMSHDECSSLLQQWELNAKVVGDKIDTALLSRVQPIQEWVAQKDQQLAQEVAFESGCLQLKNALSSGASVEELQRLHRGLRNYQYEMPEDLQRQYVAALHSAERLRKRRIWRNVALVSMLIAMTAGGIGITLYRNVQARAVARLVQEVNRELTAGRFSEANEAFAAFEHSSPTLVHRAEVRALKQTLDSATSSELQRAESFRSQLDNIKAVTTESLTEETIAGAEQLARTTLEKDQVREVRLSFQGYKEKLQSDRDEAFARQAADLQEQLEKVDRTMMQSDPNGASKLVARLLERADALSKQEEVGAVAKASLLAVQQRLNATGEDIRRIMSARELASREAKQLADLPKAATAADVFAVALKTFSRDFPESVMPPTSKKPHRWSQHGRRFSRGSN